MDDGEPFADPAVSCQTLIIELQRMRRAIEDVGLDFADAAGVEVEHLPTDHVTVTGSLWQATQTARLLETFLTRLHTDILESGVAMPLWQLNMKPKDYTVVDGIYHLPNDDRLNELAGAWSVQAVRGKRRNKDARLEHLFCARHLARLFQTELIDPMGEPLIRIGGSDRVGAVVGRPPKNTRFPNLVIGEQKISRADYWVLVLFHGLTAEPEVLGWISTLDMRSLVGRVINQGMITVPTLKLESIGKLLYRHDASLPGAYGSEMTAGA